MRTRRKILVLASCSVAAIIAASFFALHDDEPNYNGYKLSELIVLYDRSVGRNVPAERQMASQAIYNLGTNAIPFLVKWVHDGPPPLLFWNLRGFAKKLTGKSFFSGRAYRATAATHAFRALGTNADSAVPLLTRLMLETNNPNLSARAAEALGSIQRESAVQPLVAVLTNDYLPYSLKKTVALALEWEGPSAAPAIPYLIGSLESTNTELASEAAWTLGELHLRPDLVVPALVKLMHRNDLKTGALFALGEFGAQATNATATVLLALHDPDAEVRDYATNALKNIAPALLTDSPSR